MTEIWMSHGHLDQSPIYASRTALLAQLHARLQKERVVAISGLGGMGKSTLCLKYINAYLQTYQAIIWLDGTSSESLNKETQLMSQTNPELFLTLLLDREETLLVLDHIQDLRLVHNVLSRWKGHLLFTARFHQTAFPELRMPLLSREESALFVLRRGKILSEQTLLSEASERKRTTALEIARAMDGFPLALDQAGAYLEETGCSLDSYITLYRDQPVRMLSRRGDVVFSSSKSPLVEVIKQTVRSLSPKGQRVLRKLAALRPEAEEWQHLEKPVVDELLRVFLIEPCTPKGWCMHRLIQTILQGKYVQ